MEHKRFTYEVLVNASSRGLVWRKDYNGHVPDTAIQMGATMVQVLNLIFQKRCSVFAFFQVYRQISIYKLLNILHTMLGKF